MCPSTNRIISHCVTIFRPVLFVTASRHALHIIFTQRKRVKHWSTVGNIDMNKKTIEAFDMNKARFVALANQNTEKNETVWNLFLTWMWIPHAKKCQPKNCSWIEIDPYNWESLVLFGANVLLIRCLIFRCFTFHRSKSSNKWQSCISLQINFTSNLNFTNSILNLAWNYAFSKTCLKFWNLIEIFNEFLDIFVFSKFSLCNMTFRCLGPPFSLFLEFLRYFAVYQIFYCNRTTMFTVILPTWCKSNPNMNSANKKLEKNFWCQNCNVVVVHVFMTFIVIVSIFKYHQKSWWKFYMNLMIVLNKTDLNSYSLLFR